MAKLVEDYNFVNAVYIILPYRAQVTDEDNGPEYDGGKVDNLARAQLRSTTEVVIQDLYDTRRVVDKMPMKVMMLKTVVNTAVTVICLRLDSVPIESCFCIMSTWLFRLVQYLSKLLHTVVSQSMIKSCIIVSLPVLVDFPGIEYEYFMLSVKRSSSHRIKEKEGKHQQLTGMG